MSETQCFLTGDFAEESVVWRQFMKREKASGERLRAIESSSAAARD